MEHRFPRETKEGVRACLNDGCAVRKTDDGEAWQRAKGGHWRKTQSEPLPKCMAVVREEQSQAARSMVPLAAPARAPILDAHWEVAEDGSVEDDKGSALVSGHEIDDVAARALAASPDMARALKEIHSALMESEVDTEGAVELCRRALLKAGVTEAELTGGEG